LLLDSTPVECGRSLETSRRSQLAEVCGYGYSASHSRWFWGMRLTCKDLLTLERHGARTPRNMLARIATRLLALAACISLNHQLGRPSRAIANYTA
jgi:hypothetical protein